MRLKQIKAESSLGLLVAISLFALIFLGISRWQTVQHRQMLQLYQQQQALLIADNQIDRLLASLACEKKIVQNGIEFVIHQCSLRHIKVGFPLGEIEIVPTS